MSASVHCPGRKEEEGLLLVGLPVGGLHFINFIHSRGVARADAACRLVRRSEGARTAAARQHAARTAQHAPRTLHAVAWMLVRGAGCATRALAVGAVCSNCLCRAPPPPPPGHAAVDDAGTTTATCCRRRCRCCCCHRRRYYRWRKRGYGQSAGEGARKHAECQHFSPQLITEVG